MIKILISIVVTVPISCFLAVYSGLVEGWVLSRIWLWHVVPALHLPVITGFQFGAIALGVSILRYRSAFGKDDSTDDETLGRTVASVIWPWAVLLAAWLFTF